MSVLILDHIHPVIFHFLICGGIIGIFADPSLELRVIRIDSRIDHCHLYPGSPGLCPGVTHMDIIQVGLPVIVFVIYGILRVGGIQRLLLFPCIAGIHIVIRFHFRQILPIFFRAVHILNGHIFWQVEDCIILLFRKADFCPDLICYGFCLCFRGIREYDTGIVIGAFRIFQFLPLLLFDPDQFFFRCLVPIMIHTCPADSRSSQHCRGQDQFLSA